MQCSRLQIGFTFFLDTKEHFDQSADNSSLDNFFNRWVSLLGEKLSELCSSLDLKVDLFGENAGDHLGKVLIQLCQQRVSIMTRKPGIRQSVGKWFS